MVRHQNVFFVFEQKTADEMRISDWSSDVCSSDLDGARYDLHIRYSDEGWPALDTGGALQRARPLLGEAPFVLVNADVYSDYPWSGLLARARDMPPSSRAHLVLVDNPPQHPRGDFSLVDGQVREPPGESRLTFSGISIIDPRLLDGQTDGTFSLVPLLRAAARDGHVSAEHYRGLWSDEIGRAHV